MLECKSLTKKYPRGINALDHFDGNFSNGIYGLLGPNGAGKSTLMNILATLLRPTSGNVFWNGQDIISMGADYRALVGFLPQVPPVYTWMTAQEFLAYIYKLKELPTSDMDDHVDTLLTQVELIDRARDKICSYSGGMRQRLGIAQALMGDPKILLLDEPTAGLDPRQRAIIKNLLRMMARDSIVLICTHIVSDLDDIADQILMMRQGRSLGMMSPGDWMTQLKGQVWWIPETPESLALYPTAMRTIYAGQSGLRIITDRPPEESIPLNPTLEDIYLQCYIGSAKNERM